MATSPSQRAARLAFATLLACAPASLAVRAQAQDDIAQPSEAEQAAAQEDPAQQDPSSEGEPGEQGAAGVGPAAAESAERAAGEEAPLEPERPEVRAIIAAAVAEYDAARFHEAQALFRRAQRLSPSGRTLRGAGMASFEVREYVVALRALRAALVETRRPLSAAQRVHVEDLIDRATVYIARVQLAPDPSHATIEIDGSEPEREADGTVLLDAGRHTITVTAIGWLPRSLEIEAEAGGTQVVNLALVPGARGPTPTRDALVGVGLASLALAVAGGAASVVTGLFALSAADRLAQTCEGFICPGAELATQRDARDLATATDVLWVSAAILGVAGVALLSAGVVYDEGPLTASAACGPDGCAAALEGSF